MLALTADPDYLLPAFANNDAAHLVDDGVFDHLADISFDLQTIGDKSFSPHLATTWSWAPDSLSIAFSLNPAARWHDGKPVRAEDVRFTFRVYTDKQAASPNADLLVNIDSVSVRDSLTPVLWFKRRSPEQFFQASQMEIMPEHVYGSMAPGQLRTSDIGRRPIGSGRFRFVQWQPGVRLELVADTANYHGRPKLDRVILTSTDPATSAAQVLTGQADFVPSFPWDQRQQLDSSKVARGIVIPVTAYTYMAMNLKNRKQNQPHPIFGDLAVRRALSMSTDRAAMLKNVFGDVGRLGMGPFPRGVSTTDTTLKLLPYDTAAANRLLDSAGWRASTPGAVRVKNGRPLRFGLLVPQSSFFRMRYAVLLQEQLKRVGAQVDLEPVDLNTQTARMQTHDFDAGLASYSVDPGVDGERQLWGTSSIGGQGSNFGRYSNPRVDALLDSAAHASDMSHARTFASKAYQQIIDDAPAVWLYDVVLLGGANRRLTIPPMRVDAYWALLADWSIPANLRTPRDRVGLSQGKP